MGFNVLTLDIDPKHNANFVCDLLDWDYQQFPPNHFKIIAASTPCAEYSVAKTTSPRDYDRADNLVCRVLEIVRYFSPKIWWIENPQTGHLKDRPMMQNLPFVDIDYCQFSDWGYRKPTRFWGCSSLGKLPSVKCPGKTCPNVVVDGESYRHKKKLGGNNMKFGTTQKGRIPPNVIDYLLQEGEYSKVARKKRPRVQCDKGYKLCPRFRK